MSRQRMSAFRRKALSDRWTPEMRAEASRLAAEAYESWAADYPERAAVVSATWAAVEGATVERPGCDDCGRPMHPTYDWTALTVEGWRCRSHPRGTPTAEQERQIVVAQGLEPMTEPDPPGAHDVPAPQEAPPADEELAAWT